MSAICQYGDSVSAIQDFCSDYDLNVSISSVGQEMGIPWIRSSYSLISMSSFQIIPYPPVSTLKFLKNTGFFRGSNIFLF